MLNSIRIHSNSYLITSYPAINPISKGCPPPSGYNTESRKTTSESPFSGIPLYEITSEGNLLQYESRWDNSILQLLARDDIFNTERKITRNRNTFKHFKKL